MQPLTPELREQLQRQVDSCEKGLKRHFEEDKKKLPVLSHIWDVLSDDSGELPVFNEIRAFIELRENPDSTPQQLREKKEAIDSLVQIMERDAIRIQMKADDSETEPPILFGRDTRFEKRVTQIAIVEEIMRFVKAAVSVAKSDQFVSAQQVFNALRPCRQP